MTVKSTYTLPLFLMSTLLLPAQSVPPPPKPADSGPSLEATMKYIQEILNAVNFICCGMQRVTITKAQANPQDCTLSWNQAWGSGDVKVDSASRLSLRDTSSVTMQSTKARYQELGFDSEITNPISKNFYSLVIKMQPGKTAHIIRVAPGDRKKEDDDPSAVAELEDEDSANRLAKAIVHAVDSAVAATPTLSNDSEGEDTCVNCWQLP